MKRLVASCAFVLVATASAFANPAVVIPKIASVAGVRVGFDTVEHLEQQAGPAQHFTGGHPEGGRLWQSRQTGWYLAVDGFYYSKHDQRILDFASISLPDAGEKPGSPTELYRHANLPRKRMLFMNTVALGMTKSEVMQLLRPKLPSPRDNGDELVWKAKGFSPWGDDKTEAYVEWTATLDFDGGRLRFIRVDAE